MSDELLGIIHRFAGTRVLVIGEAMLDGYLRGEANRLCPEAPAPVVLIGESDYSPGGAANTAANLKALGAEPVLLSVIGNDGAGERLRAALDARSIDTSALVLQQGRQTPSKERVCAGSQVIARLDREDRTPVDERTEDELIGRLHDLVPGCDAIVVSDYGQGLLTERVIGALSALQGRRQGLLLVDAKELRRYAGAGPTVVKPNYAQAIGLLGADPAVADRIELVESQGKRLLDITGARVAAVTIDSEGALVFERGAPPYRTYARPAPTPHPSGAGDTFLGIFALALAVGAGTIAAAELASAGSAIVVGKEGTATCSAAELASHFAGQIKRTPAGPVLEMSLAYERQQGRSIVFTNGCFDIIHAGHTSYLSRAKSLGDVLVVGVNSDDGVRRLKGADRPINRLDDRIQVLSALSCVDYLVEFDEDTPVELIRRIRPDVFVKGGDYARADLPEADAVEEYGGRVEILPYVEARSTSGIIERIRRNEMPAGAEAS
jgi:D-beta-D-heptose 7-phosphate kinase / D-beta-D-heptose 1-phosphate adenosyltransferase